MGWASRPSKKDGRDAHPTITIKIVSYLIRDPYYIRAYAKPPVSTKNRRCSLEILTRTRVFDPVCVQDCIYAGYVSPVQIKDWKIWIQSWVRQDVELNSIIDVGLNTEICKGDRYDYNDSD